MNKEEKKDLEKLVLKMNIRLKRLSVKIKRLSDDDKVEFIKKFMGYMDSLMGEYEN